MYTRNQSSENPGIDRKPFYLPQASGTEHIHLSCHSAGNNVSALIAETEKLLHQWMISEEIIIKIMIAYPEAIFNAATHGNGNDSEKLVRARIGKDRQYLSFRVWDEGKGFNPSKVFNPTDTDRRKLVGGRGIFIMKYFADSVKFSDKGTCVEMTFLTGNRRCE